MRTLDIDLKQLTPWAEVHRVVSNLSSLRVVAAGVTYEGKATLEDDEAGNVTIVCHAEKKTSRGVFK